MPTAFARELLGATLTVLSDEGSVSVRITETEAYAGADDPASHAHRGVTGRNSVMFGPPRRLYVYRSYGVHWCCNITCGEDGQPGAILLRAGHITEGQELAQSRRGPHITKNGLARGPGNFGQALGITGVDDGLALDGSGRVILTLSEAIPAIAISRGPRVGVSQAADRPWRFWLTSDPTVSSYRRVTERTKPASSGSQISVTSTSPPKSG